MFGENGIKFSKSDKNVLIPFLELENLNRS